MAERTGLQGTPKEIQAIFFNYLHSDIENSNQSLRIAADLTLAQIISNKDMNYILGIFNEFCGSHELLGIHQDVAARLTLATVTKDSFIQEQK